MSSFALRLNQTAQVLLILVCNKTTTSTVKTNINSELIGSVTGGIAMAFPWYFSMEMRQEPVPIMVVMFTINFRFYSNASVWLLQESERMSTDRIFLC